MSDPITVAAISGSLRRGSFNTAALRALDELKPDGVRVEILGIADVPFYNADTEARGWPEAVETLQRRIAAADAVLFATPEYNYSVPGVLKNAIDWLSRSVEAPPLDGRSPLNGKPAAIVGATPSIVGTARAQDHLRQIVFYNAMPLLPSAEVLIANAGERFDDEGRLAHEPTRRFLADFWADFTPFIRNFANAASA